MPNLSCNRAKPLKRGALLVIASLTMLSACDPAEEQTQNTQQLLGRLDAAEGTSIAARGESLLADAEEALNGGDDPLARRLYKEAINLFESANDNAGIGRSLLGLGTLERVTGQGEIAREIYGIALSAFVEAADMVGQGQVHMALGELDRARFNNEDSLTAFRQAESLFHSTGEWGLEAEALLSAGDIERRLRNIYQSRASISRASAIFKTLGDDHGVQLAERSWEELFTYFDEYDRTRQQALLDISNAQIAEDPASEASALTVLAQVDVRAGRPRKARERFVLASRLFARAGDTSGHARAWIGLADLERRIGNNEAAEKAYTAALDGFRKIDDTESVALALIGLGQVESGGNLNAQQRFSEAREIASPGNFPLVDGMLALALGVLDQTINRMEEADAAFQEADAVFSAARLTASRAQAQLAMAGNKHKLGDLAAALMAYSLALEGFGSVQDRIGEAVARAGLAAVLRDTGRSPIEAAVQYHIAAGIFTELELSEQAAAATAAADSL